MKDNPPYVERSSPHLRTRTPVATMPPVSAPAQASPSLAHTRTERPHHTRRDSLPPRSSCRTFHSLATSNQHPAVSIQWQVTTC